jgi:hypothetical protein
MGASRDEIAAELVKASEALGNAEKQFSELEKLEQVRILTSFYLRINVNIVSMADLQTYHKLPT